MTIAQTIIDQLGGNRFIAMTGARDFLEFPDGVTFMFPAKNGINRCAICAQDDSYRMEFGRLIAMRYKIKATHAGIFFDQLEEVFSRATGLATRL